MRLTAASRDALSAVKDGSVRLDGHGYRQFPHDVNGMSLSSTYRRGFWEWPNLRPLVGDRARLTPRGRQALEG
jgi:hypothetical protein